LNEERIPKRDEGMKLHPCIVLYVWPSGFKRERVGRMEVLENQG